MPGLHRCAKATPDSSRGGVANRKPPPTPVHRRNAPITKMTKENLHQIFVFCERSAAPSERSAPLNLTWVSNSWRSLARSIPQLWTSLELRKSSGGRLPRQVAHWANLAGDLLLSLAYNFPHNFPHEFWKHPTLPNTIIPFATRVHHLALAVEPKQFIAFLVNMPAPGLPDLESLTLTTVNSAKLWTLPSSGIPKKLPRFEKLRRVVFETRKPSSPLPSEPVKMYPDDAKMALAIPLVQLTNLKIVDHRLTSARVIEVLAQCTNLVECELSLAYWKSTDPLEPITLAKLSSLTLNAASNTSGHSGGVILPVLRSLTLPALKSLSISASITFGGVLATTLSALHQRSQFDLEHLSLMGDIDVRGLGVFFQGVSILRSLCVEPCNQSTYSAFLKLLQSAILPNLISLDLTVHAPGVYIDTTGTPRSRPTRTTAKDDKEVET